MGMKKTKIVATIGPASEKRTTLESMVRAGMNVARLNFSHNTHTHHAMLVRNLRYVSKKTGRAVGILQDLQGPRIRLGNLPDEGVKLKAGQMVKLVAEDSGESKSAEVLVKKNQVILPMQYPELYKDLNSKARILIDDASIELTVLGIRGRVVETKVKTGGVAKSHKGMNFPGSDIKCPPVTKKDALDLAWGIEQGVDYIGLSFVKSPEDVKRLRRSINNLLKKKKTKSKDGKLPAGVGPKIIVKIERREAVQDFASILAETDGVMVARGDLGIELPPEDVPLIQKEIIRQCNRAGKPVIVATQMLQSMTAAPLPTRAEVSDVANAILDGTDAIMLSGESASGKYPLKAVQVMDRVADEVEGKVVADRQFVGHRVRTTALQPQETSEAIALATKEVSDTIDAKAIVCATITGRTPRLVARYRPEVPVIAMTDQDFTMRQLALVWGVQSYKIPFIGSVEELNKAVTKVARLAEIGTGSVVVVAGDPMGDPVPPNMVKVLEV